jgi:hypothetical protein
VEASDLWAMATRDFCTAICDEYLQRFTTTMTTTPNFDDLTPPDELVHQWCECERPSIGAHKIIACAARWGARHGWEQARKTQQWPEPITDRPPTEADGDKGGLVQYIRRDGVWSVNEWGAVAHQGYDWQHTPRWQPRQPSLQEQALALLPPRLDGLHRLSPGDAALIRRALEQAGEGK